MKASPWCRFRRACSSYDGNDSRLLQISSDGSGSSLTYGAAGFVNSVASWGSADDSAVSFSLLCASTDGRVLAAGGAPAGVPEFGVPSTGAGFDASVMHPLVWDENSFVPRVLGVGGSSMPSVGSLVPGAGSGAGLLDPYGWASLGVAAPAVPSAQGCFCYWCGSCVAGFAGWCFCGFGCGAGFFWF